MNSFSRAFALYLVVTLLSSTAHAATAPKKAAKHKQEPIYITEGQDEKGTQDGNGTGNDPLEAVNRPIYKFNETLDGVALEPAAKGYRAITTPDIRKGVRNAVTNLDAPNNVLNSVFQGDVNGIFTSFWRFAINSTLGIGGLVDVASEAGLKEDNKDFGQTLGMYGVPSGPYLMVPVIGPSNPRDLTGEVVDTLTNPFNYLATPVTIGIRVTDVVTKREELLDTLAHVRKTSFDPYATIKSAYQQRREHSIARAKNKHK